MEKNSQNKNPEPNRFARHAGMFSSHYREQPCAWSVESEIKRLFKCIASPGLADRKRERKEAERWDRPRE